MLSVGDPAPDFTLPDQDKQPVTLHDLRGKPVMLVFFPLAFSSICTRELCELRDDYAAYERRGVTVLGISVDSTYALRAWQRDQHYTNRFLSDRWPAGEVARRYGVWNETLGHADRGTFILDADGIVRYLVHNPPNVARDEAAYLAALDAMGAGPSGSPGAGA
ncbi:MAG: peroxiredoxin [Candidatus Limnocylindrales bacterium]